MNLLTDVFFLDNLKVIEESKKSGTMTIEGTFQRAESPNNNKRVYPKTVLTNQVGRLQDLVEARRLCGELDHPTNETVKLSNASHLITKLWMEGNEVYGRAELLNTPAGKVAQTLVNDGVSIGISSRGLGTLSESANEGGYKTVNDDYKLVTFDLVADPSTKGAYPKLSEATEYINDTSRKALREKTYVTLLKQELGQRFGDNKMNLNRLQEEESEGQRMTRMSKTNTEKVKQKGTADAIKQRMATKRRQEAGATPDEISGRVTTHKSGQKLRFGKKGNQGQRGFENAHTEYDPDQVLQVLENNIRRFIAENDDHQAAAQFVKDHSEELMEGFLKRMAAGAVKTLVPGTAKAGAKLRRAEREKARGQRPHSDQGGTSTSPSKGLQGKQTAEPEGGDANLGARVQRTTDNMAADRTARRGAASARKDADADQTLAIAKKKTIGVGRSARKIAMGKLKGAWHGAAAGVKGGVAAAREKVASKVLGGNQTLRSSSRDGQAASLAKQDTARKGVEGRKEELATNLRGGVPKNRRSEEKEGAQLQGNDSRNDAGGPGPTGSVPKKKKEEKDKGKGKEPAGSQTEFPFGAGIPKSKVKTDSRDWNVEFDYQMMRLHENIQRFNG